MNKNLPTILGSSALALTLFTGCGHATNTGVPTSLAREVQTQENSSIPTSLKNKEIVLSMIRDAMAKPDLHSEVSGLIGAVRYADEKNLPQKYKDAALTDISNEVGPHSSHNGFINWLEGIISVTIGAIGATLFRHKLDN